MQKKNYSGRRTVNSYQLSPGQLADIHRRYGRPGEMSPGRLAPKKRNRLDATLAAMDRKDRTSSLSFDEENRQDLDLSGHDLK